MPRKMIMIIVAALLTAVFAGVSRAGDEALWTVVTSPDALIIIDRSDSMDELPNGTQPTFYITGTNCYSDVPFYASKAQASCMTPTSLYVAGNSCSSNGPYTTSNPASMPTGDLWVNGTSCSADGPYYFTEGSQCLNVNGTNSNTVYVVTGTSCSSSTTYYANSSGTHTKSCTVSNMPTLTYTASGCQNGPFYTTSGSGHTNQCTKCTSCTTPFSGSAGAYTPSDCTIGPFYRSTGSGHTTSCPSSATCSVSTGYYTAGDCTNGPFYKTTGSGHTTYCNFCTSCTSYDGQNSTTNIPYSTDASCAGPFYHTSSGSHTINCSKISIAKRALFGLLNNSNTDGLNQINAADMTSLGLRLGLMSYYNCNSNGSNSDTTTYTNSQSCIQLHWGLTLADNVTTTPYANLYCNYTTCNSNVASCTTSTPQKQCIVGFDTSQYTPLGSALREGKRYLDDQKALDPSRSCRQKAIIIVTDGADTISCSANGHTNAAQRAAPVYYAYQAAQAGYKVFVVGFGADMPDDLKNTLNWMAYYGNTKNQNETQSGVTTAVTIGSTNCNGTDPGSQNLSGYAFMATNTTELTLAISTAVESIISANYSFSSQAAVAAARVSSENFIYEASFEPKPASGLLKEPFWTGHLKKYQLNSDTGAVMSSPTDAGAVLASQSASSRYMWTSKATSASDKSLTSFDTSNINAADLNVATDTRRDQVVGFWRGSSTYNKEGWKLGDLYHTNPAVVTTPSLYFYDPRECGATSFATFRNTDNNIRTSANGQQIILAGANDGQLHAFQTKNMAEIWSFIPPNLLQKISVIPHNQHSPDIDQSTLPSHDFFVDGPLQVADAWLPSSLSNGTSKSSSDWKTIAVFEEGQGSGNYLWSSSPSCYDTNPAHFSASYSSTLPTGYPTKYYCGLYALDVTNTSTTTPVYKWHLMPEAAQAPYLGEAWSKMQIGRIKIAGNERWVGFIGGGYNGSICGSSDTCDAADGKGAGKGFFVVDLTNGNIIWSFTYGTSTTSTTSSPYMQFSAPASPTALDTDGDGFIDTVYMGDLGGNMWRFRLCPQDACSTCGSSYTTCCKTNNCISCDTGSWTGTRLYATTSAERGTANTNKQIFTMAPVTKDALGKVWVYFGTGQNNDPTNKDAVTNDTKNRLYAIKEDPLHPTATYATSDLKNITNSVFCTDTSNGCTATNVSADAGKHGWYINLSTNAVGTGTSAISSPIGEKMISDPALFGGDIMFATYVPDQGTGSACGLAGNAFYYSLNYLSGAGTFDGGGRTAWIGIGIPSAILVSLSPDGKTATLYGTASGGAGTGALTQKLGNAPTTSSMTNILYWKDKRLQ